MTMMIYVVIHGNRNGTENEKKRKMQICLKGRFSKERPPRTKLCG